jgi:hypothetical protein
LLVPETVLAEIYDVESQPVLYFALTKVVQVGSPMTVLREIVRQMLGQKDVAGIPAIHDALRYVDSGSGYV